MEFCSQGLLRLWPRTVAPPPGPAVQNGTLPELWRDFLQSLWPKEIKPGAPGLEGSEGPRNDGPPLLLHGTPFQMSVWSVLLTIPRGELRSYGEVATAIGNPRAQRAVGAACGANPLPLVVPCHRVIASHGQIGGFTWGSAWKIRLLAAEGVHPDATGIYRTKNFRTTAWFQK